MIRRERLTFLMDALEGQPALLCINLAFPAAGLCAGSEIDLQASLHKMDGGGVPIFFINPFLVSI